MRTGRGTRARGPFASALMMSMVSARECCFRVRRMNDSMSRLAGLGQKNAMPACDSGVSMCILLARPVFVLPRQGKGTGEDSPQS